MLKEICGRWADNDEDSHVYAAMMFSWQRVAEWSRHSWIFDLSSPLDSRGTIRAHLRFVGEACDRFLAIAALRSWQCFLVIGCTEDCACRAFDPLGVVKVCVCSRIFD